MTVLILVQIDKILKKHERDSYLLGLKGSLKEPQKRSKTEAVHVVDL